jgi:hypothetical protein
MNRTSIAREDVGSLRALWTDLRFTGELPPRQYAKWLRMYPIEIVTYGLREGAHWLKRNGGHSSDEFIRYVSAVMRNENEARKFDAAEGR